MKIDNFECEVTPCAGSAKICYLIYPELAELSKDLLVKMSADLKVNLVAVYVPADKWNDALTPWPEPGEAKGCPPFAGESAQFLSFLQQKIIPQIESKAGLDNISERNLMGVSLGGLFTLWQWMECDTFQSVACLSGSFWYEGFIDWFNKQTVPVKKGRAYFLLGKEEPHSNVKAFQSVGVNTQEIVNRLKDAGINVEFEWVEGNHFSRPMHRAERALTALYS